MVLDQPLAQRADVGRRRGGDVVDAGPGYRRIDQQEGPALLREDAGRPPDHGAVLRVIRVARQNQKVEDVDLAIGGLEGVIVIGEQRLAAVVSRAAIALEVPESRRSKAVVAGVLGFDDAGRQTGEGRAETHIRVARRGPQHQAQALKAERPVEVRGGDGAIIELLHQNLQLFAQVRQRIHGRLDEALEQEIRARGRDQVHGDRCAVDVHRGDRALGQHHRGSQVGEVRAVFEEQPTRRGAALGVGADLDAALGDTQLHGQGEVVAGRARWLHDHVLVRLIGDQEQVVGPESLGRDGDGARADLRIDLGRDVKEVRRAAQVDGFDGAAGADPERVGAARDDGRHVRVRIVAQHSGGDRNAGVPTYGRTRLRQRDQGRLLGHHVRGKTRRAGFHGEIEEGFLLFFEKAASAVFEKAEDPQVEGLLGPGGVVVDVDPDPLAGAARLLRRHHEGFRLGLVVEADARLDGALGDAHDVGLGAAVGEELADLVGGFAFPRTLAERPHVIAEAEEAGRAILDPPFGAADEENNRCRDAGDRPHAGGDFLHVDAGVTDLHSHVTASFRGGDRADARPGSRRRAA